MYEEETPKLELSQEIIALMEHFVRLFKLLEKDKITCNGVTIQQCFTLQAVLKTREITMHELSEQMGVAISTMTRIVDNLEKISLVERVRAEDDRRVVLVRLTETGLAFTKDLRNCTNNYIESIVSKIPETERPKVYSVFKLLTGILQEKSNGCCE